MLHDLEAPLEVTSSRFFSEHFAESVIKGPRSFSERRPRLLRLVYVSANNTNLKEKCDARDKQHQREVSASLHPNFAYAEPPRSSTMSLLLKSSCPSSRGSPRRRTPS